MGLYRKLKLTKQNLKKRISQSMRSTGGRPTGKCRKMQRQLSRVERQLQYSR